MNPLTDMSDEELRSYAATLSKSCVMFDSDHYGSIRSSPFPMAMGDNEHVDEGNVLSTVAITLPCAVANVSVSGTPSVNYDATVDTYSSATEEESEHSLSEDESEEIWSADEIGDADVEPDADTIPLEASESEEEDDADDGVD
jgi:hypothetical protein